VDAQATHPPDRRRFRLEDHGMPPSQLPVDQAALLQAALNALPSPVAVVDRSAAIVLVNAAWRQAEADNGEWEDHQRLHLPYLEACQSADGPGPELAAEVDRALQAVLAGEAGSFALPYFCHSAVDERPFLLSIAPLQLPSGGALLVHQDLGGGTLARQHRAREQDDTLPRLVDHAPVLMWMADPQRRFTWFNRLWLEFTGEQLEGACAAGWDERLHPDDRGPALVAFNEAFATRRELTRKYRLRRGDGVYRWLHERARPLLHGDGSFAGFIGSCSDITEIKQTEEELQRHRDHLDRELHFAGALNRMAQAISGMEEHGRLLDVLVGILGHALEVDRCLIFDIRLPERVAVGLSEWLNPDCPAATSVKSGYPLEHFSQSLRYLWEMRTPLESHRELVNPRLQGEGSAPLLHEGMAIHSLLWHPFNFRTDGFYLLAFNQVARRRAWQAEEKRFLEAVANQVALALQKIRITAERREAETRLHQAQKMEAMSRIAGGVAHDFNNLLTTIAGYSQMLIDGFDAEDRRRGHAESILRAAERATSTTRQLLAFSRRQELRPRIVEPNAQVVQLQEWLARLLGADVELTAQLDPQVGCVRADPGQLELALMNLAVNARDFMPGGGRLTISTGTASLDEPTGRRLGLPVGEYVTFRVSDTGTGMTPDTLEHAFEPFFTTKAPGTATGLGLSSAYGMVAAMDGCIDVASTPGQGSVFTVYLPRVLVHDELRPATPMRLPPLAGDETVLLVEDDPSVLELVRDTLRHQGYQVIAASQGSDALRLAQAHAGRIDLLLADVVLPKMSGPALAARLVALRPGLKVVLMSGYPADAFSASREVANAAFLAKPFTIDELTRVVRLTVDAAKPG
jgi:PAS domain S-box-containing protein